MEAATIQTGAPVKRKRSYRGRIRRKRIDGRTVLARRSRELAAAFAAALGGQLTEVQSAAVQRAAEMIALCEVARAEAIRAGRPDPDGLVRLESAASRALRQLGLRSTPQRAAGPTLGSLLRSERL